MDERSSHGPWTRQILELIAASPATRAADLAKRIGWDVPTFKGHVRRLKELGLTESLEVGYRLSPRGDEFLRARH
jgi:DNA-binding IclR family transcriptional regulator